MEIVKRDFINFPLISTLNFVPFRSNPLIALLKRGTYVSRILPRDAVKASIDKKTFKEREGGRERDRVCIRATNRPSRYIEARGAFQPELPPIPVKA